MADRDRKRITRASDGEGTHRQALLAQPRSDDFEVPPKPSGRRPFIAQIRPDVCRPATTTGTAPATTPHCDHPWRVVGVLGLTRRETDRMLDEESDLAVPPDGLGAIVHGPVVIARAPGIAMGLRCVFGYPSGLSLLMVLRATGVQAEAASRHFSLGYGQQPGGPGSSSRTLVSVDVDGRLELIDPLDEETTSDADAFVQESTYWVSPLPRDGELSLAVGWPQAGLPEQSLRLALADLHDLERRVLPLP